MSDELHPCIWCGKPTKGSLEHLLPESLECPPQFVLEKGVCQRCNNGLGHVDQALLHEFEIVAFMSGIHRKGGKPPAIDSWAPLTAEVAAEGPVMHFNGGPQVIEARGKRLPAASNSNGIIDVNFTHGGGVGTVTFNQVIGRHPKFVRAIYKVAFGSLAFFCGIEAAVDTLYDPIRAFVTKGKGKFRALMLEKQNGRCHCFGPPWTKTDSSYPVIGMTILGMTFIVDLDPDQKGLSHMCATLPANERWTLLPFEKPTADSGFSSQDHFSGGYV